MRASASASRSFASNQPVARVVSRVTQKPGKSILELVVLCCDVIRQLCQMLAEISANSYVLVTPNSIGGSKYTVRLDDTQEAELESKNNVV